MKLVIVVIQDQDEQRLLNALMPAGFKATKLASTGGFLREGNTTLIIGVDDDQVGSVTALVGRICKSRQQLVTPLASVGGAADSYVPIPVEVTVGGATIFVLPVERFERVG